MSSHKKDRETKADMYAGAPIPTYWLVDIPGDRAPSPAEGVAELDVGAPLEDLS